MWKKNSISILTEWGHLLNRLRHINRFVLDLCNLDFTWLYYKIPFLPVLCTQWASGIQSSTFECVDEKRWNWPREKEYNTNALKLQINFNLVIIKLPLPQLFHFLPFFFFLYFFISSSFLRSLYAVNIELSSKRCSVRWARTRPRQPSFIYVRCDCNYLCSAAGTPKHTIHKPNDLHARIPKRKKNKKDRQRSSQLLLAVDRRHYKHFTLFTRVFSPSHFLSFFCSLSLSLFFFWQIICWARCLTFKQAIQSLSSYEGLEGSTKKKLRHFWFRQYFHSI